MLPEVNKKDLIKEICKLLSSHKDDNYYLTEQLVKEVFTTYPRNMMHQKPVDNVTKRYFCDVVTEVLQCVEPLKKLDLCCYLFHLLDNMLTKYAPSDRKINVELDKYGDNSVPNFSMLNKVDREQVMGLYSFCKQQFKPADITGDIENWLDVPEYKQLLFLVYPLLTSNIEEFSANNITFIEDTLKNLLLSVLMKTKLLLHDLKTDKNNNQLVVYIEKCLFVIRNRFADYAMISYICSDIQVGDMLDMCDAFEEAGK